VVQIKRLHYAHNDLAVRWNFNAPGDRQQAMKPHIEKFEDDRVRVQTKQLCERAGDYNFG